MGTKGTVASSVALRLLLQEASATPSASASRRSRASRARRRWWWRSRSCSRWACALQSQRHRLPGLRRTTSTTFQELAKQIDDFLRAQMPCGKKYPGVEN